MHALEDVGICPLCLPGGLLQTLVTQTQREGPSTIVI